MPIKLDKYKINGEPNPWWCVKGRLATSRKPYTPTNQQLTVNYNHINRFNIVKIKKNFIISTMGNQ